MKRTVLILSIAALAGLALTACPENLPVPTDPVCRGCLSSQECVADDRCACKAGFRDCDGLAENGCEVTGAECPQPCTPEHDSTFCASGAKNCGTYTAPDNCGTERSADCGPCILPKVCGGAGVANVCGQPAACTDTETDAAFCERNAKECGEFIGTDKCDEPRTAQCGGCDLPESCGGGGVANTCGQPEACTDTDADFCARSGNKDCGELIGTDKCGEPRTAQCGTCEDPESCGGGDVENVCGCTGIDDYDYCMENFLDCGQSVFTDACGTERTAWCGPCGVGSACVDNYCEPQGLAEDVSCVFDGTVLTCASPLVCISNGASGSAKVGACKRKCTSTAGCGQGQTCALGQLGNPLEGVCAVPATVGEACVSLFAGPNFCWDAAEPEGASLDCLGSECRYLCNWDSNPGEPRPCPAGESCGSAQTTYPEYPMWISVCEASNCVAESDEEFCARRDAECGPSAGPDNCDVGRSVESCGDCAGDCITGTCM